MKLLLHQCCAPCSVYPVSILKETPYTIYGFFYNPNIHPVVEFYKRLENVLYFNNINNIKTIVDETYGLKEFVQNVVYRENNRCKYCYFTRLEKTAQIAKKGKFDAFTTTLLYSKYQNHLLIKDICENLSKKYKVDFYYYDFREGWKEGIEKSKELNLYRQQYCGCIYSEEERYKKQLSKQFNIMKNSVTEVVHESTE
ncbi:epoxyqueuosine reductase QueH [Deferribacter thermophilus]|uniref:epoxyqueuosine reductase QueH n=1 Tax=Deferribacter thermophilus TaxID=53573 RepID=UPI003C19189D